MFNRVTPPPLSNREPNFPSGAQLRRHFVFADSILPKQPYVYKMHGLGTRIDRRRGAFLRLNAILLCGYNMCTVNDVIKDLKKKLWRLIADEALRECFTRFFTTFDILFNKSMDHGYDKLHNLTATVFFVGFCQLGLTWRRVRHRQEWAFGTFQYYYLLE